MLQRSHPLKRFNFARRAIANRVLFQFDRLTGHDEITSLKAPILGLRTLLEINPEHITHSIAKENRKFALNRIFRGGDWDLNPTSGTIQDKMKYKTISEILEGVPVEGTTEFKAYWARKEREAAQGISTKGPHNYSREELVAYMEKLGSMYRSVVADQGFDPDLMLEHPIKVGITRTGDIVKLSDGNHRLALAHFAKIRRMPVHVRVIHQDNLEQISRSGNLLENLNAFLKEVEEKCQKDPVNSI